jgi:hypothetical protein
MSASVTTGADDEDEDDFDELELELELRDEDDDVLDEEAELLELAAT